MYIEIKWGEKMFEQKLNEMLSQLMVDEKQLVQQDRKDEAAFVRIRSNIVNIGKTVWQVVVRTEKEENRREIYLGKMAALRMAWQESLSQAEKYEDHDKVMIETMKLSMLEQVLRMFEESAA